MKKFQPVLFLCILTISACTSGKSQNEISGSGQGAPVCEGCEAIFESMSPFVNLRHVDTLPDFNTKGPNLEIKGVVYKPDGKTPAGDVVIYIYHTDQTGRYPVKGDEKGWGVRHGYLRGWVKTNKAGQYRFYTLRPGAYPGGDNPQHIHVIMKEPEKDPYWIDDFHFADDPILNPAMIKRFQKRGGNGVVQPVYEEGRQVVVRNIVLMRET